MVLTIYCYGKPNTNLCQGRGGLVWKALFLWIFFIVSWGHGAIRIICLLLTRSLGLRKVNEERLLVFFLLLPLIKTISQDDTALSFDQGVLWGRRKIVWQCVNMLAPRTQTAINQKKDSLDEQCFKEHAPCKIFSPIYSHFGSCWCCNASCLGHPLWTRKVPDPNALWPTHVYPHAHPVWVKTNTWVSVLQCYPMQ